MIPLVKREYANNHQFGNNIYSKPSLICEKIRGWISLIVSDKNRRNLFFFLLLNFSFAFVELAYGFWSNSLGLISDSFHMFFDCAGLVISLIASIIAKRKADDKFSYGYVRAEALAAFSMGLFLMFIALTVFNEALHRIFEPPEVQHERLFIVSVLGLIVNLIGIFVFQHGHADGHCHGGHSHNHNHNHSHSHDHNHGSSSVGSQLMKGVFLHILADALGSVSVIVSTILIKMFGWMRADPVCSIFIAACIAASVIPLIKDSSSILMQRQPKQLDKELPYCYQEIIHLSGVVRVSDVHFWTLCNDVYVGTLKIEVSKDANPSYIVSQIQRTYSSIGVKYLNVQLDHPMRKY